MHVCIAATKNYDNIQINTGHFGPRVYPGAFLIPFMLVLMTLTVLALTLPSGCGLVRRGMQKTLENVSYSSPHGIQRSLVGVGY